MEDKRQLAHNNRGWKIKTAEGFVDFAGVSTMGVKQLYKISFNDGSNIEVTSKHTFFTTDGREIQTRELSAGIELIGIENKTVTDIDRTTKEQTYDIIESETHTYFANGLLCHNCVFLSSDALLINSLYLANQTPIIERIRPFKVVNDVVFFEEVKRGTTYLLGVDPATGSGEDYSVITLFEFPMLNQVAEYRSNTMSTNKVYGVLKNLLLYLESVGCMVYFSIENNGVGEGVIALYEADENPPNESEFVSEEGKGKRGFTTSNKSKMRNCVNLKEMYEKEKITIKSKVLLAELKAFIRHKGSYAAQKGSTDDAISAMLIVIRLVEEIASYDQSAFDKLYAGEFQEWDASDWDGYTDGYDENDEGMPMII